MLFYLPTCGQNELNLATRGQCLRYLASKVREGKSPSVGDDPYKNQQLALVLLRLTQPPLRARCG